MAKRAYQFGVFIGKIFYKKISKSGIYFLFPVIGMGGAERVHLKIMDTLNIRKSLLVIETSSSNEWKDQFMRYGRIWFTDFYLKYKYMHRFFQSLFWGIIIGSINKHKKPKLFIANVWNYKFLVKNIGTNVWLGDIVHALITEEPTKYLKMDIVPRINKRMLISNYLKTEIETIYNSNNYNLYTNRLYAIGNKVNTPNKSILEIKKYEKKIIYLGREATEKRLYLVGKIASRIIQLFPDSQFICIGPPEKCIEEDDRKQIIFTGVLNEAQIEKHFLNTSIIILTSIFEGLPLSIMEAMTYGVIPICTDVGGVSELIKHKETGFLISAKDEPRIVDEAISYISDLWSDCARMKEMGSNVKNYALNNFCDKNYKRKIEDFFMN